MKNLILPLFAVLILAGCAANIDSPTPKLKDLGPAPELTNTTWLNTEKPLRLENLRGKVVLLEMWTFG
jgi:hypothetical protein